MTKKSEFETARKSVNFYLLKAKNDLKKVDIICKTETQVFL